MFSIYLLLFGFSDYVLIGTTILVLLLAAIVIRRMRWYLLAALPLLFLQIAIPALKTYTLDTDGSYPVSPTRNLIDATLYGNLYRGWVPCAIAAAVLLSVGGYRHRSSFTKTDHLALIPTVILELIAGLAVLAQFHESQYTHVIASATSGDGAYQAKLIRGVNWEGDDATLVYRHAGDAYYHPLTSMGGDLTTILNATIEFRGPSQMRLWATIQQNMANASAPMNSLYGEWDISKDIPHQILHE